MKKTSKYKGVKWSKKDRKWISQFTNEGNTESTRCNDEREAAKLYDLRRIKAGMDPVNILKKRADVVAQSEKVCNIKLEKAIEKAKPNLDKIKDVDKHLHDIK